MAPISRGSTLKTGIAKALQPAAEVETEVQEKKNPLEAPEPQERLKRLQQWRRQARSAQAENRTQMAIDEDFYDSIQYEPEELHILHERNQAPLVFNVTKNTINWILGTERKTRIDYRVLPRKKSATQGAQGKTKVIKYIQDMSNGEFERSAAFTEAIKAGIGWLELGAQKYGDCKVFIRAERWRNMWFDHLGKSLDGSDWRYVFREKWVDEDVAQGLFPERAHSISVLADAVNSIYPYQPEEYTVTDDASEFDLESDLEGLFGGPFDGSRRRIKLCEAWYRMPADVQIMRSRDKDSPHGALDGVIFRNDDAEHQYLVRGRYFSVEGARKMTVRCAIFSGSILFQDMLTPYNHDRFSFLPIWCYRRSRDNMPYGVIRDLRDPQSDLNKRRSRALFLLSSNRVLAEEGAVNNLSEFHEEMNRPDGIAVVNTGALAAKKIEVIKENAVAMQHVEMARDDERFIANVAGITPENQGFARKDLSGKAIENLQLQGHTASGVYFDNYFLAFRSAGTILVSLIEQFFDQEEEFRITGDRSSDDFVRINATREDGTVENPIRDSKADFVVSKQDYRETLRLAMFQMLSELVQGLAQSGMSNVALSILDLVIDFMDEVPNKDEILKRIRKLNNQSAPDDDMSPEERAAHEKAAAAAAQEQEMLKGLQTALLQMDVALKKADVSGKEAKAMKDTVEAQMKKLDGFLKALQAAGALQMNPELAAAADTLIEDSQGITGPERNLPRPGNGM